ncbi:MAG: glycosyltransferase family 2 protein, partial [Candidatus Saccharibacteria bacterium]
MIENSKTLKVCIIMPAYNEARVIKNVIKDAFEKFKSSSYDFKIVVINDASTDDTEIVAKKAGAIVISHILNSGAGNSTATGLLYAQQNDFDIAATMDSDGQHLAIDTARGIDILIKNQDDLLIG